MITLRVILLTSLFYAASVAAECWRPVVELGRVQFIATQAGAPFPGSFSRYSGEICLEPQEPGGGRIEISIDTGSVDTGLPEFDDALRAPEFFDSAQWSAATFNSKSIEALEAGKYFVRGTFTLKGISREITVPFAMVTGSDGPVLEGQTEINRLDYKVGVGEWEDTRWVGNPVTLKFAVKLSN